MMHTCLWYSFSYSTWAFKQWPHNEEIFVSVSLNIFSVCICILFLKECVQPTKVKQYYMIVFYFCPLDSTNVFRSKRRFVCMVKIKCLLQALRGCSPNIWASPSSLGRDYLSKDTILSSCFYVLNLRATNSWKVPPDNYGSPNKILCDRSR